MVHIANSGSIIRNIYAALGVGATPPALGTCRSHRQGGVRGAGGGSSESVAGPAGSAGERAEARGAQDRPGEGGELGPSQARRTVLTRAC